MLRRIFGIGSVFVTNVPTCHVRNLAQRRPLHADLRCRQLMLFGRVARCGVGTKLYDSVVGTYRLSRRANAARSGGFYTAKEYDISDILAQEGELLELGRSCVAKDYRSGHTMALLWRGIAAYVFSHDIAWIFGCASLRGTEPEKLALPLSYLHHFHLAPEGLRPRALDTLHTSMDRIPMEQIEKRLARELLPPLIKGYLRVGCFVGHGAVVDSQFQTTDVCVVLKTDRVSEKYRQHYENNRRAANII